MEIDSRFDGFTVADLAAALNGEAEEAGDRSGPGLCIDGCWHSPDTPLTSVPIWEGALLEAAPWCEQPSSQSPPEREGPAKRPSGQGRDSNPCGRGHGPRRAP